MITDCHIEKGVSSKTNREYYRLVIVFKNGYRFSAFLNQEQVFILRDVVPIK